MKNVVLFLVVCGVAFGVVRLFERGDDPTFPEPGETGEAAESGDVDRRMIEALGAQTGTLSVRARTTDGEHPVALEVGYLQASGGIRWRYADEGERVFTDAPLGLVETAARARGYPEVRQKCQVIAGVPCHAVILLKPGETEDE